MSVSRAIHAERIHEYYTEKIFELETIVKWNTMQCYHHSRILEVIRIVYDRNLVTHARFNTIIIMKNVYKFIAAD